MKTYTLINIDGLDFPFNSLWKRIAISLSGGADSALLAYIVCTIADPSTEIHVINFTRLWKTKPWQEHDAQVVYNYLVNKFPKLEFTLHKSFIAPEFEWADKGRALIDEYGEQVSGDMIQQRSFAEYVCHRVNADAYYNAVTKNPTGVEFKGLDIRDEIASDTNQHKKITKHMGRWAVHPFRFIEKSWVLSQYKRAGILDLFEITRSCEGQFPHLNYITYIPGQHVPTCGECFWCKEREWAIEQSK